MNIYGVLKQEMATHPKVDPHHAQLDVLKAYRAAEGEFTGKWDFRGALVAGSSAIFGLTTHMHHIAVPGILIGEGMRQVPKFMARRDTRHQIEGHHFSPDAPDSRFAERTAELLHPAPTG
jgi:hypothetical protein